jgi:hypothetical protein
LGAHSARLNNLSLTHSLSLSVSLSLSLSQELRPVVQKLASIESQAQCSFLKLRARFNKA